MTKSIATISLALFISSTGSAKEKLISIDSFAYPSPASIHFDMIERELARKAVQACGNLEAVVGISEITMRLRSGIGHEFAVLSKDGSSPDEGSLYFVYPHNRVNATVQCRDK